MKEIKKGSVERKAERELSENRSLERKKEENKGSEGRKAGKSR